MTKLTDINTQLRSLLEDNEAKRFSDSLLGVALGQALDEINQRLPRLLSAQYTVTVSGRDQLLSTLTDCRYIVSVTIPEDGGGSRELEPETCFTYLLTGGVPTLHFLGAQLPAAGDRFTIRYTAGYTIEGFAGQLVTTLPAEMENALVNGAAAQACFLRAGSLVERYGSRGNESSRLTQIGNLWRATFERTLNELKVLQEFGFPP
ncbi:MAG: hypothetical protein ABFD94_16455, partial [Armatimonadia bacterium]